MADSPYSVRPGGSLKLKGGGVEDGGIKKKKKSKSKSTSDLVKSKDKVRESSVGSGGRDSPAAASSSSGGPKTDAERRFEEIQKQRLAQRVAKMAKRTHKDRVHEFNSKLEALSEHHDIPKVGPG